MVFLFYFFLFFSRCVITKTNPINSNNIVKIIIEIVNDGFSFLNKKATGMITTAASIKITPILSLFSIKQIHTKLP
jgi:hypothetical protein